SLSRPLSLSLLPSLALSRSLTRPLTRPLSLSHPPFLSLTPKSILKKAKCEQGGRGNVTFDMLTVFLFPRCQGFSSVPSRGGCSLGMVQRHSALRRYTLEEYAVQQRVLRREKLINRLREEKLDALKQKVSPGRCMYEADRLTVDDIPEDEMDVSSYNLDDGSFLHPYPSKRRHALLKAAGVKMVQEEKRQLQQLRVSREDCGCDCQGFCEPETCACSLAGIKCQMDHSSFPCGCTKDGCGNQEGRIEFNSSRVQTHYIHTIMKLELEKRLEETSGPEEEDPGETTQCHYYNPLSDLPSIPDRPSFHFSSELAAVRENSCSSDMTDSSGGSEYSEEGAELVVGLGQRSREDGPLLDDVDENGLRRILSFSDIDNDDDDDDYNVNNHVVNDDCCPEQRLQQQPWMLTDLSSESDLEFFDGFCLGPSSLYNSLKEYQHMDNFFHFQLPSYHSSQSQACDPGACLLESLIGLSESVPEPPATFRQSSVGGSRQGLTGQCSEFGGTIDCCWRKL
uniref:Cysteine-serine-rich nuclear protein 1b n=1 Tax=Hucho hucho TaxID=62062 RepID=A0A4W5MCK3_9TELE